MCVWRVSLWRSSGCLSGESPFSPSAPLLQAQGPQSRASEQMGAKGEGDADAVPRAICEPEI